MTEALRKQGWTDVEFSVMDDVDLAAELNRGPALPHAGSEGGHKWCAVGRHAVLPDRGRCPDHGGLVEEWD